MSNKIVYEDFAIGATDYAYVDLTASDHQMQTAIIDNETVTVDPYHVDSIFDNQENDYASLDVSGFDTFYPFNVFTEGEIESGEVVGGDELGFVSDRISNASNTFSSNPKLVIKFSDNKTFSGSGIGVYFSKHYCTKVKVRYQLYDDSYTDAVEYTNDSMYAFFPCVLQGYKTVEIEFVETERAYQYVVVKKIEFGHVVTIDKLRSVSFNKKIDFYCSDVPINTMDAEFVYDGELTFYNNQKILLYHNDDLIGTYWVAESERKTDKIYSVTAEDGFSRLEVTAANPVFGARAADGLTISDVLGQYSAISVTGTTNKYVSGYFEKDNVRRLLAESMFAFLKTAKASVNGTVVVSDIEANTSIYTVDKNVIIGDAVYRATTPVSSIKAHVKKYNDGIFIDDKDVTVASGVTITTTESLFTTDFPAKTIGMRDKFGEIIPITDEYLNFRYGVRIIDNFHFGIWSDGEIFSDVYICACPCDYEDVIYVETQQLPEGSKEIAKDFGARAFYRRVDESAWIDSLKERAFSATGEVKAKVVLNYDVVENEGEENEGTVTRYLDVGDYVSIETKYSGTKSGTITEIDADVGENDIIGNVVITVWD